MMKTNRRLYSKFFHINIVYFSKKITLSQLIKTGRNLIACVGCEWALFFHLPQYIYNNSMNHKKILFLLVLLCWKKNVCNFFYCSLTFYTLHRLIEIDMSCWMRRRRWRVSLLMNKNSFILQLFKTVKMKTEKFFITNKSSRMMMIIGKV
jgi:hypothetical protein